MKVRVIHWLLLAAALVAAAAAVLVRRAPAGHPRRPAPVSPLSIVPPGAAFVMTMDLARLRTTAAGRALARAGLNEVGAEQAACGFELLRDVEQIAVSVPAAVRVASDAGTAEAPAGSLALVAAGRFAGATVAACIEERVRARGGEPIRTQLGTFSSVRERGTTGEVAVRNGLLVLSDGPYLRALLDTADGHAAPGTPREQLADRVHAELRRSFGTGAEVIGTFVFGPGWLETLLDEPNAGRSPLAALRSAALRAAIRERVELGLLLACETESGCAGVERLLLDARRDFAPLFGPDGSKRLAELHTRRSGPRIELALTLEPGEVQGVLDALTAPAL